MKINKNFLILSGIFDRKKYFHVFLERGGVNAPCPVSNAYDDKYRDSIEYRDTFARYLSWKKF